MARYNEILVGRFNRFLQKLTSIKGEVPAPQLSGEIMAVLPLFNGVENRYLDSWDRFGVTVTITGGVGTNAQAQLRNPANSNVMIVVEMALSRTTGISPVTLALGTNNADLGTTATVQRIDSRTRPKGTGVVTGTANAALPTGVTAIASRAAAATLNNDFILTDDQELTLLPGDLLSLFDSVANEIAVFTFLWRERYLEESERT